MRIRPTLAPTAATAVLLLLTACGGDGGGGDGVASLDDGEGEQAATETTLSEEEAEEALLDWAQCMRDQGIDIEDPQVGEGGIRITVEADEADESDGGGAAPANRDDFEAATEECGEPPRVGGEFTEEERQEMQDRALAFAECMRENGVEDFPDPDFSDSGPGAGPRRRDSSGGGGDGEGAVIAGPFGEVDLSDPEVEAAFEACQEELGEEFAPAVGRAERGD